MNARMDAIKRLAESDPYWRAYLDGMADRHAIRRNEPTDNAWREYARLAQARLDRNADTTDYDSEWTPVRNRAGQAYPMPIGSSIDEMRNMVRAVRNAADLSAPRCP